MAQSWWRSCLTWIMFLCRWEAAGYLPLCAAGFVTIALLVLAIGSIEISTACTGGATASSPPVVLGRPTPVADPVGPTSQRNGVPVGELAPLRRHRFVSAETAVAMFRNAPRIDAARFRDDEARAKVVASGVEPVTHVTFLQQIRQRYELHGRCDLKQ